MQRRGGVSLVSVPYHELLDSPLTVWFVVTEHDFSLLCYSTFWWVMKGFIPEATSGHAYLTWSLPLVPVVQFTCSSPVEECQAGRRQLQVSLCQNQDIIRVVSLCCFFWCIWTVINLMVMCIFFCRPKMLKLSGFDILAVLRPPLTLFLSFLYCFHGFCLVWVSCVPPSPCPRLVLPPTNERRQESKYILLTAKPCVACHLQQE